MPKAYVDIELLENVFRRNDIPYTNIFDELIHVSAEEIARDMPVSDLRAALEEKEQVFAAQVWVKEDIVAALRAIDVEEEDITDELVETIAAEARSSLEDCSDNWERLHNAVSTVMNRRTGR